MYQWVEGSRLTGDVEKIGTVCAQIVDRMRDRDETCKAEAIVKAARNPKSPLHPYIFGESIQEAVAARRLSLARHLLRSIAVVYGGGQQTTRAFVSLRADQGEANGGGYRTIQHVLESQTLRGILVKEALEAAERWQRRYGHLRELEEIFGAIERARQLM